MEVYMYKKMVVILVMCLMLVGCAGTVQDNTLKAYSSTGIMLENIHTTSASLCDAKYVAGKTCNKMVDVYGKAKATYIALGNTAIIVANASETLQKQIELCKINKVEKCDVTNFNLMYQSALIMYQKQSVEAQNLFNELVGLSSKLGGTK
jgi:hypothetical protein